MSDPLGFYLLAALGLLGSGLALRALRSGQYAGGDLTRVDHPREFWSRFTYQMGLGSICLVLALWKLFDRGPRAPQRDVCEGYDSSWDCFLGEHLQSTLLTASSVLVVLGLVAWRWYQRRAMRQIAAAADRLTPDETRRDSSG